MTWVSLRGGCDAVAGKGLLWRAAAAGLEAATHQAVGACLLLPAARPIHSDCLWPCL